jgi:DHA1 family tetracycline resistance protein-like MFS transporter
MKRSPLLVIFVTVLIDLIGFGIVIPVLPYYLESPKFNATPLTLGLLFASYSVMQLLFTPILGRLSDRYGRRPVLFLSLLGTGVGFVLIGLANSLWMLFAGRILDGITGGNISTAQAYVADVTTPENRAKGMGMVGAAFGLGFIIGPALGGELSQFGIEVPFLFAAALSFANATLLYFVLPETVKRDGTAQAVDRSWRGMARRLREPHLGLVVGVYFLFIVAFSIMTTTFALYTMHVFGYDARDNGRLFAFIGMLGVILQGGLIGRLVQRFGELPFIIMGAALFVAGLFALPLVGPASGGLAGLLLVLTTFANGNAMTTPTLTSLASKAAGTHEQGEVLGVMQSGASLARIVGPLVGTFLIEGAGREVTNHSILVTFWTAGGITLAALLLSVFLARMPAPGPTVVRGFAEN